MSDRKKKRRTARRPSRRPAGSTRSRRVTPARSALSRSPRRAAVSTDRHPQHRVSPVQVSGPVASQMYGVSKEWLRRHPDLGSARRKINNKTILYRVDKLDEYFRGFDAA